MRIAASSATWSGAPTLPPSPQRRQELRRPRPGPKARSPSRRRPAAPPTAPPAPESNRPGWLQLVLRFWWVGLIVIGGGIAAFNYLGGSRPVTELSVGDCFDLPEGDAEEGISDVTKRECTEPHQYEMFFVGDLPDGPFPSEAEMNLWIDANCLPAFTDYVGIDYRQFGARRSDRSCRLRMAGTMATTASSAPFTTIRNPQLTESVRNAAR